MRPSQFFNSLNATRIAQPIRTSVINGHKLHSQKSLPQHNPNIWHMRIFQNGACIQWMYINIKEPLSKAFKSLLQDPNDADGSISKKALLYGWLDVNIDKCLYSALPVQIQSTIDQFVNNSNNGTLLQCDTATLNCVSSLKQLPIHIMDTTMDKVFDYMIRVIMPAKHDIPENDLYNPIKTLHKQHYHIDSNTCCICQITQANNDTDMEMKSNENAVQPTQICFETKLSKTTQKLGIKTLLNFIHNNYEHRYIYNFL